MTQSQPGFLHSLTQSFMHHKIGAMKDTSTSHTNSPGEHSGAATQGVNSSASEPVVHLTLSMDHAQALIKACDIFSRLGMGQMRALVGLARFDHIPPAAGSSKDTVSAEGQRLSLAQLDRFEAQIQAAAASLGYLHGHNHSISSSAVNFDSKAAHEVQKVLEREVAMHQDPTPAFKGVKYDGLLYRMTDKRTPNAKVEMAPVEPMRSKYDGLRNLLD